MGSQDKILSIKRDRKDLNKKVRSMKMYNSGYSTTRLEHLAMLDYSMFKKYGKVKGMLKVKLSAINTDNYSMLELAYTDPLYTNKFYDDRIVELSNIYCDDSIYTDIIVDEDLSVCSGFGMYDHLLYKYGLDVEVYVVIYENNSFKFIHARTYDYMYELPNNMSLIDDPKLVYEIRKVDHCMRNTIFELNSLRYATEFCCSGHNMYEDYYIMFKTLDIRTEELLQRVVRLALADGFSGSVEYSAKNAHHENRVTFRIKHITCDINGNIEKLNNIFSAVLNNIKAENEVLSISK